MVLTIFMDSFYYSCMLFIIIALHIESDSIYLHVRAAFSIHMRANGTNLSLSVEPQILRCYHKHSAAPSVPASHWLVLAATSR